MRRSPTLLLAMTSALAVGCAAPATASPLAEEHEAGLPRTSLVSLRASGLPAKLRSTNPSLSGDGGWIAFESKARALVPDESIKGDHIYLRELATRRTTLVDRGADGRPARDDSFGPALAADGTRVSYTSRADNLVPGFDNSWWDIFLYDVESRTTKLVTKSATGGPSNGPSGSSSISADGRFVALDASAPNLVAGEQNGYQIYLYDARTERLRVASSGVDGAPADGDSYSPVLSADGRFVTFFSFAANLVAGDTNGQVDVFRYDRVNGQTILVSRSRTGGPADGTSVPWGVSGDGRYVVISSDATNLIAGDTNGDRDVFLVDVTTGTNTLVSRTVDGAPADGHSNAASISADGRLVTFESDASDLVADDDNGLADVFVHDLRTRTTVLISRGRDGASGDRESGGVQIAGDGTHVAYHSSATNLVRRRTFNQTQVYVSQLARAG